MLYTTFLSPCERMYNVSLNFITVKNDKKEQSDEQLLEEFSEKIMTISQLIIFDTVKKKRNDAVSPGRHSKFRKPTLPVYSVLLIHNKTRKKGIVNAFAEEGLSISYKRLEQIQNKYVGQLCQQYENECTNTQKH